MTIQNLEDLKVKTKEHSMTKGEYLAIIVGNYLRHRWWLFFILWALAIILIIMDDPFAMAFTIVAAFSPLIAFLYLLYHAWTPKNKVFYLPRVIEIDHDFLSASSPDGGVNRVRLEHFISAKRTSNSFILRLSKLQFVFVPFRAFENNEDEETFGNIIKSKGLLK